MAQTKGNGKGVAEFATGTLVSRHNLKFVLVDLGGSITSEDDAPREAVERALQIIQPLAYYMPTDTSGQIHAVVDGSQFSAAALEAQLQEIGTDSVNGYDFSSATVTLGTALTVA